jgi:hypothetical protein
MDSKPSDPTKDEFNMNLESKIYAIKDPADEDRLICYGILQFPENTNVKHWERIANRVEMLLSQPKVTLSEKWNYRDLVSFIDDYISQHHESGFRIQWIFITDDVDFLIRI